MTTKILTLFLAAFTSSFLYGGIKIPKHVFNITELEEAQQEAKEKSKVLAFVYSDPESTWGLCNVACEKAFKKLRSVASIVFIDSQKSDWAGLPKAVKTGLSHADAGKFIPKVTFTDIDAQKHILSVRYESWNEESKLVREIKKTLKEEESNNITSAEPSKSKPQQYLEWKNLEGKAIKAKYVKLEDDLVTLILVSGSTVKYPINKLTEDSQKLAKSLYDSSKENP